MQPEYCDYSNSYGFINTSESCKALAEKVMSGDELHPFEKEFICQLITPLKNQRGRNSKYDRNLKLAQEEEILKKQGVKSKDRIKILGKQFELPGLDDVAPRTYYKLLNIGKALLVLDRELAHRKEIKKAHLV